MIPYSRPKRSDLYTQLLENHTLHSGTGLTAAYAYIAQPPPPGDMARKNTENVRVRSTFPQAVPTLSLSSLPPYFFSLSGFAPGRLAPISMYTSSLPLKQNLWESLSPIHSSDMSFFIEKRAGFIEHNSLKCWLLGQPVDGMFVFVQHDTVFHDKDKGQNFCHTFKFQYTWLHPK